jgi:hypothetical protein
MMMDDLALREKLLTAGRKRLAYYRTLKTNTQSNGVASHNVSRCVL